MSGAVIPDVRSGLAVVLRALVAGTLLGAVPGCAIALGDPTLGPAWPVLPGILLYACGVGAGVALLAATGRLVVVGHGPRWAAKIVAGTLAALPLLAFSLATRWWWAGLGALLVGAAAALVARWQGYERDRPARSVRRTSSNAPSAAS